MFYHYDVFIPRIKPQADPLGALKNAIETEKQSIACLDEAHALLNLKIIYAAVDSASVSAAKNASRWREFAELARSGP